MPNLPSNVRVDVDDKTHSRPVLTIQNLPLRIMGDYDGWLFTLNGYYGYQQENTGILVPTGLEVDPCRPCLGWCRPNPEL